MLEPIPSGLLIQTQLPLTGDELRNATTLKEQPVPNQMRPRIKRTKQTPQKLATTLPVLISLPLLVVLIDLTSITQAPLGQRDLVTHTAVLFFLACLIVGLSHLPAKFGILEKRIIPESWSVVAGLLLFFLSPIALSYTRVSVVFFCLFLNGWNLYTPLALICDCFYALQTDNAFTSMSETILGYLALGSLYIILRRALSARKGSMTTASATSALMLAIGGIGAAVLVVLYNCLNPIFFVMTLAVGAILMILVNGTRQFSSSSIFIVAVFLYVFENYILRTSTPSLASALVLSALPLIVKIDHEWFAENEEGAGAGAEKKLQVLQKILAHSDTRAIFNFLLLNTTFMFIQLVYLFKLKSLGLLSDSLHMALDCASLALGLVAGTLLKQEADINSKYPFGLRQFEILAGFANGTLLVGISGSIVFEAIGRLYNPVDLLQTTELIIVSTLGLLVNIVGIFAFNHGHHGHSHGHSHGPPLEEECSDLDHHQSGAHIHNGSKDHDEHSHSEPQNNHSHAHNHAHSHSHSHAHGNGCDEPEGMNDNMRGIFLHILADTLGSVGVVISTILIKVFGWQGFDPVASIAIAILIFLSAGPLMSSTASTLLLKLSDKKEAIIRSCLNDLTMIRGIKSFSTPRFWAKGSGLTGYIHIQVYRGESTSNLRGQCQAVFKSHNVEAMIQMEKDYDSCWCR